SAGSVLTLQQNPGEILEVYSTETPRGSVSDVAIANGQVLAAASHYGAYYVSRESSRWMTRSYPEKGWALSVNKVLIDGDVAYLALNDKRQVIAIDTLELDEKSSPSTAVVFNNIAIGQLASTQSLVVV